MKRVMFLLLVALTLTAPRNFSQVMGLTHGQPPHLPAPYIKPIVANLPRVSVSPGFKPQAPQGFTVSLFANGFKEPRWLAVAPNGDVFVSDTSAGKVYVLGDPGNGQKSNSRAVFAAGLKEPFGIAFHADYVYVADTNKVVRFRYDPKTSRRAGEREPVLDLPGGGMHFTRTVQFSPDGNKMYVSVGSPSNVTPAKDPRRAAILVADPEGRDDSIYASGLRNAVGIGFDPDSGQLWASVNERDLLGDNLPPDYFTHVVQDGFYGWPYSYIGKNVDARAKPPRPDLVAKALVPDVLLGPHVAPLEFAFYTGRQFPAKYWHGAFVAEHGSWNRSIYNGYRVVFIPFKDGQPQAAPSAFLTGFDSDPHSKSVNGRPVGVAVAKDGSLLVSDDGGRDIWRISRSQ
ncbi:MAG: PQQ-dependent sugar dehydrogenase [Terriglobia bacterium]